MGVTGTPLKKRVSGGVGGGVEKVGGGSDRARLVEAVAMIVKNQDALISAVDYMRTMCPDTIEKMDNDLAARRTDLEDFVARQKREMAQTIQDVENSILQKRVELEQALKMHSVERANEVLREHGQVSIDATELQILRDRVAKIDDERNAAIEQVTRRLQEEHAREMEVKTTRMTLENKAITAEMHAVSSHQKELVEQLKDQIASLKKDIEAQRKLTADVASASRVVVESSGNVKH